MEVIKRGSERETSLGVLISAFDCDESGESDTSAKVKTTGG